MHAPTIDELTDQVQNPQPAAPQPARLTPDEKAVLRRRTEARRAKIRKGLTCGKPASSVAAELVDFLRDALDGARDDLHSRGSTEPPVGRVINTTRANLQTILAVLDVAEEGFAEAVDQAVELTMGGEHWGHIQTLITWRTIKLEKESALQP